MKVMMLVVVVDSEESDEGDAFRYEPVRENT
jgi:hypothetical protein